MAFEATELGKSPTAAIARPRLSVIIPVRNDPARLARCLAALARSTFTDFEIIVADDASTDHTAAVAESKGVNVVRLARRGGAAAARNVGAERARGDILLFVDSDVCVHPDTVSVVASSLDDPDIDAVFGSYDLEPAEPNLLSQYKNLAHRFYHQNSRRDVGTFWTGCGAIRRETFDHFKFDAQQFTRPSIEDIELGARLTRAGKRIVINHDLQATHLKRWTLSGIVRSDLFDRAIPWTRVILRQPSLPGDLNLSVAQRIAALLAALSAALFLAACWFRPWLALVPPIVFGALYLLDRFRASGLMGMVVLVLAAGSFYYARWYALAVALPLVGVVLLNASFYRFFIRYRGWLFAIGVALPMQVLYYLYSIAGFGLGTLFHHWETMPRRLDDMRVRVRLYIALALLCYLVSWGLVLMRAQVKHVRADFVVSDAIGYYAYLPSLVIDHDLQFDNQLAAQGQTDTNWNRMLRRNRWPIGVALSLLPAFLLAHGGSLLLHTLTGAAFFLPNGYTPLYDVLCVAWIMALGTAGMILIDRLIVERLNVPGRLAGAAVLATWLGTNYCWYFVREPLLTHMIGASWVIFCVYLIHRIEQNAREGEWVWWHLPLLAFVASMALVCRMTNAFMLPMFIFLAVVLLRRGMLRSCLRAVPLVLLALAPLVVQWAVMRQLGLAVSHNTQDLGFDARERFYWTQPALLRILISSRHGLFFGTPSLLLAAWGLVWWLWWRGGWRRDPLITCFALGAIPLWYLNAAWYAWWFGASIGNRGFVELAGLYAIGFAMAFVWYTGLRPGARRVVVTALALCILVNYAMMAIKLLDIVADNQYMIPWEEQIFTGRWKRI